MLHYLLFLNAVKQVVITVDSNTPINSTTPFTGYREWYFYELITLYMHRYKLDRRFLNTIGVIKSYFEQKEINGQKKPSILELKTMLIINILYKFKLGNFNMAMLEFESFFDNDLVHHYSIVCDYSLDSIQDSIVKHKKDHNVNDYLINRSFSYVFQAYINLMFDVAKFQMDRDLNFWQNNRKFRTCLREFIHEIDPIIQQNFMNEANDSLLISISSNDILTKDLDVSTVTEWIKCCEDDRIHILIVLSILDVLNAIGKYEKIFDTDDHKILYSRMKETITKNKNISMLSTVAREYKTRMCVIFHKNSIIDYEMFFVANMQVTTVDGHFKWIMNTLLLNLRENTLFTCLIELIASTRS